MTSKLKGDPLPFVGSKVNQDGFWEAFSDSEDSDEDGEPRKMLPVKRARKHIIIIFDSYEMGMRQCVVGWMQEVMEMRQWLVKVSQEASQWKEKAVHAEEEVRATMKGKIQMREERDEAVGLQRETRELLKRQRQGFYQELLDLKSQLVQMQEHKDPAFEPQIACTFCATFLKSENEGADDCTSEFCTLARQQLLDEVESLQRRVEHLKGERTQLRSQLEEVKFEASQQHQKAQEEQADLQARCEAVAQVRKDDITALEELLAQRIAKMETEKESIIREAKQIVSEVQAAQAEKAQIIHEKDGMIKQLRRELEAKAIPESNEEAELTAPQELQDASQHTNEPLVTVKVQEMEIQVAILEESLWASEKVNTELVGELDSIRVELSDSIEDILKTRHIVAAVETGTSDLTPWHKTRSARPSSAYSRASTDADSLAHTEDVSWTDHGGGGLDEDACLYMPDPIKTARVSKSRPQSASAVKPRALSTQRPRPASAAFHRPISAQSSRQRDNIDNARRASLGPASATFRYGVQPKSLARAASAVVRESEKPDEGTHTKASASYTQPRPTSAHTVLNSRTSAGAEQGSRGVYRPTHAPDPCVHSGLQEEEEEEGRVQPPGKAFIDPRDIKVMDRLLIRADQLNQRVQKSAQDYAARRTEEIQRVLVSNVWEDDAPLRRSKKEKSKRQEKKIRDHERR